MSIRFFFKILIICFSSTFFISCTKELCKAPFSDKEKQFVSYVKDQPVKMMMQDSTVVNFNQISYQREFAKNCGKSCTSESETFNVVYRSNWFEFHVNLDAGACTNYGSFSVISDDMKSYNPDRWIFAEQTTKLAVKYPTIAINGIYYSNVYEIQGWDKDSNKIYLLYNQSSGVIRITFANGVVFTRID